MITTDDVGTEVKGETRIKFFVKPMFPGDIFLERLAEEFCRRDVLIFEPTFEGGDLIIKHLPPKISAEQVVYSCLAGCGLSAESFKTTIPSK